MKLVKRSIILFVFICFFASSTSVSVASGIFNVSTDSESKSTEALGSQTTETTLVSEEAKDSPENKAEATKEEKEPEAVIHVVKSGESLWGIAQKYFGDGSRYAEIVEANKGKYPGLIKNPNLIHPGWELIIPQEAKAEAKTEVETKVEAKAEGAKPTETKATETKTSTDRVADSSKTTTTTREIVSTSTQTKDTTGVSVDKSSSTSVKDVSKVKPLTTMDKINKLNQIVENSNMESRNAITKLDNSTIKGLINKGYMTEEEWMDLNPPAGWGYVIKDGRVTLENRENRAISNAELIIMAIQETLEEGLETVDAVAEATRDVSGTITDAMYDLTDAVEDVSYTISDGISDIRDAIDEVKDSFADAKKSFKDAKQEIKDALKDIKSSTKTDSTKTTAEKIAAEADKQYKKSLRSIGMPDLRDLSKSDYFNLLNLTRFLSASELVKYGSVFTHDLATMQKNLRASQETYINKVNSGDTNWIGGSINTAAKNVEKNEANLKEVWEKYKKVVEIANATAKASAKQLRTNERELKSLKRKRDRLGYKISNAKEIAALTKEIKALEKENEKLQKDVDTYAKVESLLKKMK
jgi:LysM repeat protein